MHTHHPPFHAAVALALALAPASMLVSPAAAQGNSGEAAFLAENDAAMSRMMNDMAVRPTGDIDRDFVAMMVPHHQGAIDMALALLRHGRDERLRRLAQEIIVTQQQEIMAMRLAAAALAPPHPSTDEAAAPAAPHHHPAAHD